MPLRQRKEIQEMSRSSMTTQFVASWRTLSACRAATRGGAWPTAISASACRRVAASAAFALLLPALATAAVWPDTLGAFHRVSDQPVSFQSNQPIWDEYGFREG